MCGVQVRRRTCDDSFFLHALQLLLYTAESGWRRAEDGAPEALRAAVGIPVGRILGEAEGLRGGGVEPVAGDPDGGRAAVNEGGEEDVAEVPLVGGLRHQQALPLLPRELEKPRRAGHVHAAALPRLAPLPLLLRQLRRCYRDGPSLPGLLSVSLLGVSIHESRLGNGR
ncbi:unnamed protein product, partial [Musa acuminata subsp. burmannicoides]